MIYDQNTLKIANSILDNKIVSSMPNDFFEYISNIIVNADFSDEVPTPEAFDEFIVRYKDKEIYRLINYLNSQNLIEQENIEFSEIYGEIFLERYSLSFKKNSKYMLRRIQTPNEYGTWSQAGIKDAPTKHYIAFDIDRFVPKLANGTVDITKLSETENTSPIIANYFSTISQTPLSMVILYEFFESITTKGFLTLSYVYGNEVRELCKILAEYVVSYMSTEVYKYLAQGIDKDQAIENITGFYAQMIFPPNLKFPKEMEEIEIQIKKTIKDYSSQKMSALNKRSVEKITFEMIESILNLIQSGEFVPLYYYKFKFREGSILDIQDYNAHIVADIYTYEKNSKISDEIFESYGLVIGEEQMSNIVRESFANKTLFNRYSKYNTIQD